MLPENLDKETLVPLLPFGETLRPLILSSSLRGTDLRFLLQKRGVFVKSLRNSDTVPILMSILLSPLEFEILKNRQNLKESTPKTSDAKINWVSDKTVIQALPDDTEQLIKNLMEENSSYRLTSCSVQNIDSNKVVIDYSIERLDWTKDAFSSTTYHDGTVSISKDSKTNIATYQVEYTAPETKDVSDKFQDALYTHFQQQGVIPNDTTIQRILANHFFENKARYEYLIMFTTQKFAELSFQGIIDIDAGVDHKLSNFPESFDWLKDNIDQIELHGKGIHLTDILKLGELGALAFGEIEAEYKFEYTEAKGSCTIRYGFPDYYKNKPSVEFEAKVSNLSLHPSFIHVSKKSVRRYLLQQFLEKKYLFFDTFVNQKKADPRKRNLENQYVFEGTGWE
ncbi:MAG: hypothetical protein HUU38_21500 [Anaerolineales bacterium]|nr:hypothetical protein [Anaerolineales bacterium]